MKPFHKIAIILTIFLLFIMVALSGCGKDNETTSSEPEPYVQTNVPQKDPPAPTITSSELPVPQPSPQITVVQQNVDNNTQTPVTTKSTVGRMEKTNDEQTDSAPATNTIHSQNNAPSSSSDFESVYAGSTLTGSVTGSDPEGDNLTYTVVEDPQHGSLSLNPDGTYSYTPGAGFEGSDSFTFKVNDGALNSEPATVSITVLHVNVAPSASDSSESLYAGSTLTGSVTGSDPEGDSLTYSVVDAPQHGSLALNPDGSYTYTPGAGFEGSDSFTFKVNDGALSSEPATVSITVLHVNVAPRASDSSESLYAGSTLTGSVTGSDPEGDNLTYSVVEDPQHGSLSLNPDGTYSYTPGAGFKGSDSFTFKVNDGALSSEPATVTIDVQNHAPVAVTTSENLYSTIDPYTNRGMAYDSDDDPLTYSIVAEPSHGTVTMKPDGSFTYTPEAGYYGSVSFSYKANDGYIDSKTAIFTFIMHNNSPSVSSTSLTIRQNTSIEDKVQGTDKEGDTITYVCTYTPTTGTLIFNSDGSYKFTPFPTVFGPTVIRYKAYDGYSYSQEANIDITIVQDAAPVVPSQTNLAMSAGTPYYDGAVSATDADGDSLIYEYTYVYGGTIAMNSNGSYRFTVSNGYTYVLFDYRAYDGTRYSSAGRVIITITG